MSDDQMMLLRIYTDEAAYFGPRRLYEAITIRAREADLAGATVLQALIGFGRTADMHRRHMFEDDRSVVVEIIDEEGKLRAFVESLSEMVDIGLITIEPVEVLSFGSAHRLPWGGEQPGEPHES